MGDVGSQAEQRLGVREVESWSTESATALRTMRRNIKDFPVVQWLRICLPVQGTGVQLLVGELKSYMPWGNEVHVL